MTTETRPSLALELARSRGFSQEAAKDLLERALNFPGISSSDQALERLTKGPEISGFTRKDFFGFSNEDVGKMLEMSFGLGYLLKSRIMEIKKTAPDHDRFEFFNIIGSTDFSNNLAAITIREYVKGEPSQADYLDDLPLSRKDKIRADFLGVIAHEVACALREFGISELTAMAYERIVGSPSDQTWREDFANSVRIFLINSKFLEKHFPEKYRFIKTRMPYLHENVILEFLSST
jgi:hypothetical protein